GGNRLGSDELVLLARAPRLAAVRHLDLGSNALAGPDLQGIQSLSNARQLRQLRRLRLDWNHLHSTAIEALAPLSGLMSLTELDLSHNPIGDQGAEALARSPALTRLHSLNLKEAQIGERGVEALAQSPYVRGLRRLNLWGNPVGDGGAQALASSPYLGQLVQLDVSRRHMTRRGLMALATSVRLAPRLVAALTHPAAFLRVLGHGHEAVFHPVYEGVNTVGYGHWVDVALGEQLKGDRHECTVHVEGDRIQIRDRDTPGGLQVNACMVTNALLSHGDRLTIGEHRLELRVVPRCHIRQISS
ncbi:MAG: hypothetical protein AAFX99_28830, partial [Myxococcota bacterium]